MGMLGIPVLATHLAADGRVLAQARSIADAATPQSRAALDHLTAFTGFVQQRAPSALDRVRDGLRITINESLVDDAVGERGAVRLGRAGVRFLADPIDQPVVVAHELVHGLGLPDGNAFSDELGADLVGLAYARARGLAPASGADAWRIGSVGRDLREPALRTMDDLRNYRGTDVHLMAGPVGLAITRAGDVLGVPAMDAITTQAVLEHLPRSSESLRATIEELVWNPDRDAAARQVADVSMHDLAGGLLGAATELHGAGSDEVRVLGRELGEVGIDVDAVAARSIEPVGTAGGAGRRSAAAVVDAQRGARHVIAPDARAASTASAQAAAAPANGHAAGALNGHAASGVNGRTAATANGSAVTPEAAWGGEARWLDHQKHVSEFAAERFEAARLEVPRTAAGRSITDAATYNERALDYRQMAASGQLEPGVTLHARATGGFMLANARTNEVAFIGADGTIGSLMPKVALKTREDGTRVPKGNQQNLLANYVAKELRSDELVRAVNDAKASGITGAYDGAMLALKEQNPRRFESLARADEQQRAGAATTAGERRAETSRHAAGADGAERAERERAGQASGARAGAERTGSTDRARPSERADAPDREQRAGRAEAPHRERERESEPERTGSTDRERRADTAKRHDRAEQSGADERAGHARRAEGTERADHERRAEPAQERERAPSRAASNGRPAESARPDRSQQTREPTRTVAEQPTRTFAEQPAPRTSSPADDLVARLRAEARADADGDAARARSTARAQDRASAAADATSAAQAREDARATVERIRDAALADARADARAQTRADSRSDMRSESRAPREAQHARDEHETREAQQARGAHHARDEHEARAAQQTRSERESRDAHQSRETHAEASAPQAAARPERSAAADGARDDHAARSAQAAAAAAASAAKVDHAATSAWGV